MYNFVQETLMLQIILDRVVQEMFFLAVDSQVDPKIQYVAKRVHVDNVQAEKADTFRRELEVNKKQTCLTYFSNPSI